MLNFLEKKKISPNNILYPNQTWTTRTLVGAELMNVWNELNEISQCPTLLRVNIKIFQIARKANSFAVKELIFRKNI